MGDWRSPGFRRGDVTGQNVTSAVRRTNVMKELGNLFQSKTVHPTADPNIQIMAQNIGLITNVNQIGEAKSPGPPGVGCAVVLHFGALTQNMTADTAIAAVQTSYWSLYNFATYFHNTFLDLICSSYASLLGKIKRLWFAVGYVASDFWEYDDVYELEAPFLDWNQYSCDPYQSNINAQIAMFGLARTVASLIPYLTISVAPVTGPYPTARQIVEVPVATAEIYLVADLIEPVPTLINKSTATTKYYFQKEQSDRAQALWAKLSARNESSPYYSTIIQFQMNIGSYLCACNIRAAIDKNNTLYLLSTGYYFPYFTETDFRYSMTVDYENSDGSIVTAPIFEYPTYGDYNCATIPLNGGKRLPLKINFHFSGEVPSSTTEFGAEIAPMIEYEYFYGMHYYGGCGPRVKDATDRSSWWFRIWSRAFSDYPCTTHPIGYDYFAGRFPTHPLVTGQDLTPGLAEDIPDSAINTVCIYLNAHFTYLPDVVGTDCMQFMSSTNLSGDCEDWAATAAQLLIDMGYSIHNIDLEYGQKPAPTIEAPNATTGHLWLNVGDGRVISVGELTTRAAMIAEYNLPQYQMRQSDGETNPLTGKTIRGWDWSAEGYSSSPWTVYPFPTTFFDYDIINSAYPLPARSENTATWDGGWARRVSRESTG